MTQLPLIEPTGPEVLRLALSHAKKAEAARKQAAVAIARGWEAAARFSLRDSEFHEEEAECLGMLAQLEQLGGVYA